MDPLPFENEQMLSTLFPQLEDFGLLEAEGPQRPASDWSITKIGSLQAKIEAFKSSRRHRSSSFTDGLPLHKLISFANESFGYDGWATEVLETIIIEDDIIENNEQDNQPRYSFLVESKVRLTLKDGTRHEETGRGRANQFPVKAMALNKSKKESVTNGIKTSIESLCYILLMHESRLRSGYYAHDADDDIFSYK